MQNKNKLFVIVLSLFSLAVNASTKSVTSTSSKTSKILSKMSATVLTNYESNQYESDSSGDSSNLSVSNFISYKTSSKERLTVLVPFDKSFNGEQEETLGDGYIQYGKSHKINSKISITDNYRIGAAWSEDSIQNTSKITTLTWTPSIVTKIKKPKNLISLDLLVKPYLKKNFHEYRTARTGRSNAEYQGTLWLELDAGLTKKVNYLIGTIGSNAITYFGQNKSDSFKFYNELVYTSSENSKFHVGVSNAGSMNSTSGQKDNISFYNETNSKVYVQSTLRF